MRSENQQTDTDKTRGNGAAPPDGRDISSLWIDTGLGDPLTAIHHHHVPVGRPRDFFRTHPSETYRRRAEVYVHQSENMVGKEYYLIGPVMQGRIEEARPCIVVVTVDRLGSPRVWPLPLPREGERDNASWETQRAIARDGIGQWVKLIWQGRAFISRPAEPGYAPDPDFAKLPPFDEVVRLAFGDHGQIWDEDHAVFRDLFGKAAKPANSNGDPLF